MVRRRRARLQLPHSISACIVSHCDPEDILCLSIAAKAFTVACQEHIFRTFAVKARNNESLTAAVTGIVSGKIARYIRRLRISYAFSTEFYPLESDTPDKADRWLTERDALFANLIPALSTLRTVTVTLYQESPYADSFVMSILNRTTLVQAAQALASHKHGSIKVLRLNLDQSRFSRRGSDDPSASWAMAFVSALASPDDPGLRNLTHLAIADFQPASANYVATSRLSQLLCTLPALQGLMVDNYAISPMQLMTPALKALQTIEIIDEHRTMPAAQLIRALVNSEIGKSLRNLRICSFDSVFAIGTVTELPILPNLHSLTLAHTGRSFDPVKRFIDRTIEWLEWLHTPSLQMLMISPYPPLPPSHSPSHQPTPPFDARADRLCDTIRRVKLPDTLREVVIADGRNYITDEALCRFLPPLHVAHYNFSFRQRTFSLPWQFSSEFKSLE